MIRGRLYRADSQACLLPGAARTGNALERMRGLLGRPQPAADEGLIIEPCSSVHTLGMGYAIDLAFLDGDWVIMKAVHALRPWRMAACRGAAAVLELREGTLQRLGLESGVQLVWHNE